MAILFTQETLQQNFFCIKCGRIEIIDGTAFVGQQTKNSKKPKTRKYTFKYTLNKLINEYKDFITPLINEQINTANIIFEQIEYDLPKKNIVSVYYLQNIG